MMENLVASRQMASGRKVPIRKSLASLKKRVKDKEKKVRRWKAELLVLSKELHTKNLEVTRLHQEIVQIRELVGWAANINTLANYFVEAMVATWDD